LLYYLLDILYSSDVYDNKAAIPQLFSWENEMTTNNQQSEWRGKLPGFRAMNRLILQVLLSVAIWSLYTTAAVARPVIRTQAPCPRALPTGTGAGAYCFFFNPADPIPVVRAFLFNAPNAGAGLLTFNGTMSCTSFNTSTFAVTDFASQIVTAANAVPTVQGPGGLRHGMVLLPNSTGNTDTFNLASTRVISFPAAGPRTFYFKLAKLRMDANTRCYVYNATFSITFAP
jgi:hypothetical protein